MPFLHSIQRLTSSGDIKLKRLINYWAVTALLYVLCVVLLWFEVKVGAVQSVQATWLTIGILGGSVLFYGLIRTSSFFKLTPSQLAFSQGLQAIICIIAAYAIAAPVRGAILTLLLVVLVFCAFALHSRRSHQISAFAIVLLGVTMLWCVHTNPREYDPNVEIVHFVLASSMMVAVVFLTSQFNRLRNRLKMQKAELEKQRNDLSEALAQIQNIASRDDLTALPNRRHMKELLTREERRHQVERSTLCLALLDIDHFKSINDTYGHATGDEVLRNFAQQVKILLRNADVLARWGGEEFLLLLPNTEQDAAMLVLERLKQHLAEIPLKASGASLRVTFSAGLAVMTANEPIAETIRRADKAMFRAKSLGRNTNCAYDPQMEAAIMAREQLKAALAYGILANQLVLHYQPQVTVDGQVTGAEALVRWQHPEKGLIFPAEFIPLAEEGDMIIALGQWVLTAACEQLAAWAKQDTMRALSLSVNVSAKQLRHPDFVQHTLALLNKTGIDPANLKLELTESMLVDDLEGAITKMNQLRAVGVRFSLDDFGTGYSSLSYLKKLPLDQIKIDKSFVSDIVAEEEDGMIARAIINLSHSLGFNVLAEGVETERQRNFLACHGCHDFQGYFYGKPVPLQIFEQRFCEATT